MNMYKDSEVMEKLNVGIATIPICEAGLMPLSNLVDIVSSFSGRICLITGDAGYTFFKDNHKVKLYGVGYRPKPSTFARIVNYIPTQLKMAYRLIQASATTDLWIFYMGAAASVLPMLTAKLLGKKIVSFYAASDAKILGAQSKFFLRPMELLGIASLILSNRIVVYSENLIQEWDLEKYRYKISIAHEYFVDFDKFKVHEQPGERQDLVGYIGRLSDEKGILNFIRAIPEILKEGNDVKFLVGGEGRLRDKIDEYLREENLNGKVKLPGWIPHDQLPDYLNELKLLVLPSYTEGLPSIMLEGMACGTPVLATPVGAIPDVVKDGETGFIMEDNSPECIAKNVIRAFNHPSLEQIVKNARALIGREYTYQAAVERYRNVLNSLKLRQAIRRQK